MVDNRRFVSNKSMRESGVEKRGEELIFELVKKPTAFLLSDAYTRHLKNVYNIHKICSELFTYALQL